MTCLNSSVSPDGLANSADWTMERNYALTNLIWSTRFATTIGRASKSFVGCLTRRAYVRGFYIRSRNQEEDYGLSAASLRRNLFKCRRRDILAFAMPVIISMLRGVNVGGYNKIKMDALRALCESMGLRNPQTYIQSGNVIFKTSERNLGQLAKGIQDGIARKFGFRPEVILRTSAELREAIARNPFAKRRGIEPSKLLVTFLAGNPGSDARASVMQLRTDPEEVRLIGRELYIYFPNGQGRSKLSWAIIERTLKTPGTGRNWNSVTKMLEIAERLGAGE